MNVSELIALVVFAAAMSFSPGPNTTLSTALAANRGLSHAMRFCLAVPVGWALLLLACWLGVGVLVTEIPALRWAVKGVGVSYLLYLALKLLRQTSAAQGTSNSMLQIGFLHGVALQFVNIKAWMLALSITAGWVIQAGNTAATNPGERLVIVSIVMMFFAFSSNFIYALTGSLLKRWMAQGRRLLWLNRALAAVLTLTGVWMLTF